jgi:uncharacterized peroxidase-related enzyme
VIERPDVYAHLAGLANIMLHQTHPSSTLKLFDRELIGSHVSSLNGCDYCHAIHGAIAIAHQDDPQLVHDVKCDMETSKASAKMKALLKIACMVKDSGKEVNSEAIEEATCEGATEIDIHDTVLIASMFCMFNRYVEGLRTEMPKDLGTFERRGKMMAVTGYQAPTPTNRKVPEEEAHYDDPPAFEPSNTQPPGKLPLSCGHSQYYSKSRELDESSREGSADDGEKSPIIAGTAVVDWHKKYFCAYHRPCGLEAIRAEVLAREKEARSELLPIAEVRLKRWWRGKPSQVDT